MLPLQGRVTWRCVHGCSDACRPSIVRYEMQASPNLEAAQGTAQAGGQAVHGCNDACRPSIVRHEMHASPNLEAAQGSVQAGGQAVRGGRRCRWSFGILMYELVYGFTPFRGAKRDQTFENILKRPLVFPPKPEISKPCQVRGPSWGAACGRASMRHSAHDA